MAELTPKLSIRALAIGYRELTLVKDINLSVSVGEIVGIIGANGCGKSTLLRTVCGLIPPISGLIEIDGKKLKGSAVWRRVRDYRIGYLPQGKKNFPGLTVRENLHLALWHTHAGWAKRETQIGEFLQREPFDSLRDHLDKPSSSLSGGQDMLLALAKCLLLRSKLFLLDEPSSGLSESNRIWLVQLLRSLVKDAGILLIEQSLNTVFTLADTVYLIRSRANGKADPSLSCIAQIDDDQRQTIRDSYESGEFEAGIAEVSALFS